MLMKFSVLLAACLVFHVPITSAEDNMIKSERKVQADANGDNKISYDEYRASKEKAQERQFKKMDSNGDGFIDAAEKQAQKDKMLAMREKRK